MENIVKIVGKEYQFWVVVELEVVLFEEKRSQRAKCN